MRGFVTAAVALTAVPAGIALQPVPAGAQESFSLSGSAAAVHNLAGEVTVRPGSGSEVQVRVRRGGARGGQLAVDVLRVDGVESLVVRYPFDEVVYPQGNSQSNFRVNEDGTLNGGRRRVSVNRRGSGAEAWADIEVLVPRGRDIRIYNGVGRVSAEDVQGNVALDLSSGPASASNIDGNLWIDTGSGSVDVADVRGTLSVDTGSGSIDVSGVVGGEISIDTGSGSVEASDLQTPRLLVDTGSGGVRLQRVRSPRVLVDTGSGRVDVELLETVERLEIDTGSGGVTVRVPEGLDATLDIDTGSGTIDVDFPLEVRSAGRSHLRGRVGSGRGEITIETGSGGIRLIRN